MDHEMKITLDLPGAGAAHNFNEADPWTTITVSRDAITFDMELRNPHHNERHRIDFDSRNEARDFAYFVGLLTTALRDNRARLEEDPHVIRRLITFFAHMSAFLRATNLTDEEWTKQYNASGYGQSREEVLAILAADLKADEESEATLYSKHKIASQIADPPPEALADFEGWTFYRAANPDEIARERNGEDPQKPPSSTEGSGLAANIADAGSTSAGDNTVEAGQKENGEAR
jgi:hypothetical protein